MIEWIGCGTKSKIQCSDERIRRSGAIRHIGVDSRGIAIAYEYGVDLVVACGPVEQYGGRDVPIRVCVVGDVSRGCAGVFGEPVLAVIREAVGFRAAIARIGIRGRRGGAACGGKDGRPGMHGRRAANGIVFELGELGKMVRAIVGKGVHYRHPGRIGCGGREVKNGGI